MTGKDQHSGKNRKYGRNRDRSPSMKQYKAEHRSEKNRIRKLRNLAAMVPGLTDKGIKKRQPNNKQLKEAIKYRKEGKRRVK